MIVQLVQSTRRRQPRVGGCKLYRMLKPDLLNMGIKLGRDRFYDVLRAEGLLLKRKKRYHKTTNSNHRFRIYENLIDALIASRADEIWVSDITYLRVTETFIYLALITDLYSRKIIGYDISESLNIEGSMRALKQALRGKNNLEGTIHHSDRGIQYCSIGYTELLTSKKIQISMAAKGNPYENAVAERVNGILKEEFLLSETFKSNKDATKATRQAIAIYNKERIHMSIDYKTPDEKYRESRVA
jgi:putative transposase